MSKNEDSTDTHAQAMKHLAEALKLSKAVTSRAAILACRKKARRGLVESTLELRRLNEELSKKG
jgi:hypothetical protein